MSEDEIYHRILGREFLREETDQKGGEYCREPDDAPPILDSGLRNQLKLRQNAHSRHSAGRENAHAEADET